MWVGNQLTVVAAFAEQALRMRFLEKGAADFGRRDVGGDCQHWDTRTVAIEQAVDEVQVAWSAASSADSQFAGQVGLGAGGEGGDLLVPHGPIRSCPAVVRHR